MEEPTLYVKGVPNSQRFFFLSPMMFAAVLANTSEAINVVAERLNIPAQYIDDEGYEIEITTAAIHPEEDMYCWVQCQAKEYTHYPNVGYFVDVAFHLLAVVNGKLALAWEIETYNPYFGCKVGHLSWLGSNVILIYREKHHSYICSLSTTNDTIVRREISDKWVIVKDVLGYRIYGESQIRRYALPALERLEPLTEQQAIEAGFIRKPDSE